MYRLLWLLDSPVVTKQRDCAKNNFSRFKNYPNGCREVWYQISRFPQLCSAIALGWAKMFSLKEHKTYFPHTLNSPEHWGSVIPFPDRKFYGYEAMNKAARKAFLKFYRKERKRCRNRFDVNNTLVKYCCQDVTTLRACSQQFRELFMTISDGICSYSAALTISGLCNYFW